MTTAVDTSVLLDILIGDPLFSALSEESLKTAHRTGRLIVCESVVAEISPVFSSGKDLSLFLSDTGIEFLPAPFEAAILAGRMYKLYLGNKGKAKRVLPDFLVAAHAVSLSASLLARDRGYYREYFSDLLLIDPSLK